MEINKYLTVTNYNKADNPGRVKYIVIHYVGATGGALDNCKYFYSVYREASAHYFVGHEGEIWQCVEDGDIAWHCGAKSYKHAECRNHNSIGIELCCKNNGNWYFEDKTVESAIELTKMLMKKYNVPVENVIRHYDVTGKSCPRPYVLNNTKHTWDDFKNKISELEIDTSKYTKIMGIAKATSAQMQTYIKKVNPSVSQSVIDMIPHYLSEGESEGVRGDIAFAQSCLETGNFGFSGSAVTLDQNNFCGMGVTSNGVKGTSFDTPQLGIRAQIQHLKAYACTDALKNECIDPRFKYVKRGCATYVEYLGIKENPEGRGWAAGVNYGEKILRILSNIIATSTTVVKPAEPKPEPSVPVVLYVGDEVRLVAGATYTSGKSVPSWLLAKTLYAREIRGEDIVVSTLKSGAITGVVNKKYLTKNGKPVVIEQEKPVVTPEVPVVKPEPVVKQEPEVVTLSVGDEVKLVAGAKYTSGASIPVWLLKKTLYVRELRGDSTVISTLKSGAITGVVAMKYLTKNGRPVEVSTVKPPEPVVKPSVPVAPQPTASLSVGDTVKLVSGAKYSNGSSIPSWLFKKTLYVRELQGGDKVVISTLKSGAITGVVLKQYLTRV